MRAEVHGGRFIPERADAQPSWDGLRRQGNRPEDVVSGRSRAECRLNEEKPVDPDAAERPLGGSDSWRTAAATAEEPRRFRARARVRCGENGRGSPGNPRLASARESASASATSASRPAPQPTQTTFAGPARRKAARRPPARGRRAARPQPPRPPRRGRPPRDPREARRKSEGSGGAGRPAPAGARASGRRTPRAARDASRAGSPRKRRGRRGSTFSPSSLLPPPPRRRPRRTTPSRRPCCRTPRFRSGRRSLRQKDLKQYEHSWMNTRSNIWSHCSQKM